MVRVMSKPYTWPCLFCVDCVGHCGKTDAERTKAYIECP